MRLALALVAALALGCARPRDEASQPSQHPSSTAAATASTPPPADLQPGPATSKPESTPAFLSFDDRGRITTPVSASPEPLRGDQPVPPDSIGAKETNGLTFHGEWRWVDVPAPVKAPEVSAEGLSAARKLTAFKWTISVTEGGRLRIVFDSRSFPAPLGAELRARADRSGHGLVFPGGALYRPVPPGALRALFGDRRLDVMPLVTGQVAVKGPVPARGGRAVRRLEITSKIGTLLLDLAQAPEAGQGAALLCRTLVELIAVDPGSPACAPEELPVRAQLSWPTGGGITFEAGDLAKRREIAQGDVFTPPLGSELADSVMPPSASGLFLTRDEVAAFRTRAVDVGAPSAQAPFEGLVSRNATDSLRYLVVDGIPVAWTMPSSDQAVPGFQRGKYVVQWRSFLGDAIEPPRVVEIPARVAVGEAADAGPPAPAKPGK